MKQADISGNRREFETRAVRVMAEGKGRTDLLPLVTICDAPWPPEEEKTEEPAGHKDPTGAPGECGLRPFCEHLKTEKEK